MNCGNFPFDQSIYTNPWLRQCPQLHISNIVQQPAVEINQILGLIHNIWIIKFALKL